MENKLLKEIYELVKNKPQDKINTIILYELHRITSTLQASYELQQLFVAKSGVEGAAGICSANAKELAEKFPTHNIKNLLGNLE